MSAAFPVITAEEQYTANIGTVKWMYCNVSAKNSCAHVSIQLEITSVP